MQPIIYKINNDYSGFPDNAEHGDTHEFHGRTYVFNSRRLTWIDASIPDDGGLMDSVTCIAEILKPNTSSAIHIISKKVDIEADKYID